MTTKQNLIDSYKLLLDIQEYDMKMIRLMRLKHEREKELKQIHKLNNDLIAQAYLKEEEIIELKKDIRIVKREEAEVMEKLQKLESQQGQVKKVDEFNALTQEMSTLERQRMTTEQKLNQLMEKLAIEEEVLANIQKSCQTSQASGAQLELEINENIAKINEEGKGLLVEREKLREQADPHLFSIYERLIKNKKNRVLVPMENRTCTGCHVVLTAQHENMVRKAERIVFCEHCSRMVYWNEDILSTAQDSTEEQPTVKRRRRRVQDS